MSLPSPRPELSQLLLDAIRRRDAAIVARLTGQWAHRHGVTSLESFRTGSVVAEAGWEAGDWLLQHMDAAMAPASVTMAEAFAALEDSFAGPPPPVPSPVVPSPATPIRVVAVATDPATDAIEPPLPAAVAEAEGAAGQSDVIALHPLTPSTSPAPAPPTLADLRCWLSAAPQHRRAS
ncbi:hypothetical protein L107_09756 [Cyanobium sp. Copco_Reservoir_LC18]|uniref:hypothetical protein n=1 Tax=Cyanobium sp. Copco_Reservoir_LC18 TaxID=1328305 RepID=UPI00135CA8BA|nr:hypothetical protein [Cyanobium sp. Copco_Reservoir_LC18]KAF0653212.1 hypothetical protein L107_09756 [Cyanobium sp. Copco_Reservoir_LC18]